MKTKTVYVVQELLCGGNPNDWSQWVDRFENLSIRSAIHQVDEMEKNWPISLRIIKRTEEVIE